MRLAGGRRSKRLFLLRPTITFSISAIICRITRLSFSTLRMSFCISIYQSPPILMRSGWSILKRKPRLKRRGFSIGRYVVNVRFVERNIQEEVSIIKKLEYFPSRSVMDTYSYSSRNSSHIWDNIFSRMDAASGSESEA